MSEKYFDAALVRELFDYDEETGELIWLPRPRMAFATKNSWSSWNSKHAGKRAGSITPEGRRMVKIKPDSFLATHLIWAWMTGGWTRSIIDHKNRDPSDDAWANLRLATNQQNKFNSGVNKNNIVGKRGVSPTRYGKFIARISVDRTEYYLGTFHTADEAETSRIAAERRLHGAFARAL